MRCWLRRLARELWGRPPASAAPLSRQERLRRLALYHLAPCLVYGLLAILVSYPLVLHLTTHLPSNAVGGDALQNYWNFWWTREALASGQNPYWMPLIYAPYGAPLYLHTLNLFNGLLSLPFQLLFGLIPAYNAVVLLSLVLAAYFAALLVGHVTGSRLAGFFGGVIYAFGSYHLVRMLGHTNLLASEWLPVYALCLLRANETGGRRRTGFVVAAAVALLLLLLCDWQFIMFSLFYTALYSLSVAVARRRVAPLLIAVAVGGLWCLLAAPVLLPTIGEIRAGVTQTPPMSGVRAGSADLVSYLVPGPLAWQWGRWPAAINDRLQPRGGEIASFIGYLPLALCAVALWRDRQRAWFWLLATLVFIVLSLGPYLKVAGVTTFGAAQRSVPLPYLLVRQLPGLNIARVPARFSVMVTLCVAVLAGLGLAALLRRFADRLTPRARLVLAPLLLVGLVGEHIAVPVPLEEIAPRPFYQQLGASSEPGVILEWPYCKQCGRTSFDQTVHGRPVVGGYISRRLAYPIRDLPPHRIVEGREDDIIRNGVPPDLGRWALRYSGVRWIVLNLRDEDYKSEEMPAFLGEYAAPEPRYQDGDMAVYDARRPESQSAEYLELGDGWAEREFAAGDRTWSRWFSTTATFVAWTLSDGPRAYTLSFDTWSYHQPRRLAVSVDGRVAGQWQVQGPRHVELALTLPPGQHQVALRSLDPPVSPASVDSASRDTRSLAFNVANLELRP